MAVADVSAAMLVLIDGVETRVYAVLDEHGTHMKNDDGLLYETEGGLRISVLRVEEPMRNTPPPTVPAAVEDSSRGAPSPLWQTTPPPVWQPTPSPGPSCYSPPPSGGGERDAWHERKSRFLITKYKEAKDNIGRKGGFRTKKAMWEKLTDQINSEFGCHLTPLQVENKWKTMERAYKKSKAKKWLVWTFASSLLVRTGTLRGARKRAPHYSCGIACTRKNSCVSLQLNTSFFLG
ncbi:uncharacterized protein LOC144113118 isoform X2 [Amblyomma americanum]